MWKSKFGVEFSSRLALLIEAIGSGNGANSLEMVDQNRLIRLQTEPAQAFWLP